MRRRWPFTALVGVACVALVLAAGCGQRPVPGAVEPVAVPVPVADTAAKPVPRPALRGDARLAAANLGFGLRLFQELAAEKPKENVFISPTSVALALAMTYNGAAGETKTAMAQALGLQGLSLDEVNRAASALTMALEEGQSGAQVAIANSLWVHKGITLVPAFVDTVGNLYRAQAAALDFNDRGSARTINDWVSGATRGTIPEIVSPSELNPLDSALLSAMYFKAYWTEQFQRSATKKGPFTLLTGKRKTMPMMSQGLECPYLATTDFQAVALPYDTKRFRMLVFLPDKQCSLAALIGSLTGENWDAWMRQFSLQAVDLKLPRFTVKSDFDLKAPLSALGLGLIFDRDRADFSAMAPGGPGALWIDQAKHKAYVVVDEHGTEAAAATTMGTTCSSRMRPPDRLVPFIVDRPFLCAIEDTQTQAIVFMGAIVDPQ